MPEQIESTHVLLDKQLVLYQRERSNVWQCRYKVDGVWQRATTKETSLDKAKAKAKELMVEGEIRRRANLPFITRKFRHVARLAIQSMDNETKAGRGKVSFADYVRVINEYLIPYFGNLSIANVDYNALEAFDAWRIEKMGKAPSHSTLLTQNSALNRVFDEAVTRNFLTHSNRPKLVSKGKASDRRPAFAMVEIHALLGSFDSWIEKGRNETSQELRRLLRDYVEVLLDTGARPGDELLNLKWKQIKCNFKLEYVDTVIEGEPEPWESGPPESVPMPKLNRSCEMVVDGKTGERTILGMEPTIKALMRLALRNYGSTKGTQREPLKGVAIATNNDFVFRTKEKAKPTSFQNLFESYLDEHSLLIDPLTEQKRVFYSLRHTYATLALTHDEVPIHTLAKQMGTSVMMIEKHYSHLDVIKAIEQLRGEETRRLIQAGSVIDDMYLHKPKLKKAK